MLPCVCEPMLWLLLGQPGCVATLNDCGSLRAFCSRRVPSRWPRNVVAFRVARWWKSRSIALNDLLRSALDDCCLRTRGSDGVLDPPPMVPAFIAVAGISALLAIPRYSLGAGAAFGVIAFLIRWVLYFGWFPLVVACLDDDDVLVTWRRFDIAILVIAAFGIFQFAFLPGFAQMIHTGGEGAPEWDIQGRRVVSTFLDPNFAGLFCVSRYHAKARVAEGWLRDSPTGGVALSLMLKVSLRRAGVCRVRGYLLARGFSSFARVPDGSRAGLPLSRCSLRSRPLQQASCRPSRCLAGPGSRSNSGRTIHIASVSIRWWAQP